MKICDDEHRLLEVKRSHNYAMLYESTGDNERRNAHVVLINFYEIKEVIHELQNIYDEILYDKMKQ